MRVLRDWTIFERRVYAFPSAPIGQFPKAFIEYSHQFRYQIDFNVSHERFLFTAFFEEAESRIS